MTLTYNTYEVTSEGSKYRVFSNISPDTSYPAGGYPVDKTKLGLNTITDLSVVNAPKGVLFNFDKATQKLVMGDYSGGGGALGFSGTPMGTHSHTLSNISQSIPANPDTYCLTVSATGFFVVGETITGGTSGATATVTVGNTNPTSDLGFTPLVGSFTVGETITGGTSGTTAIVASGWFRIYVPTSPPLILGGCAGAGIVSNRPAIVTTRQTNAYMQVDYNTLVGAFLDFEIVTGGTTGNTMDISLRESNGGTTGTLHGIQVNWSGGPGFQPGETLTGGTSGATAIAGNFSFMPTVVHRPTSSSNATGDFILFYPYNVNFSPATFVYYASSGLTAASAGTPAGTITGGGGASFSEYAAGTNVAAILANFDIIVEGN